MLYNYCLSNFQKFPSSSQKTLCQLPWTANYFINSSLGQNIPWTLVFDYWVAHKVEGTTRESSWNAGVWLSLLLKEPVVSAGGKRKWCTFRCKSDQRFKFWEQLDNLVSNVQRNLIIYIFLFEFEWWRGSGMGWKCLTFILKIKHGIWKTYHLETRLQMKRTCPTLLHPSISLNPTWDHSPRWMRKSNSKKSCLSMKNLTWIFFISLGEKKPSNIMLNSESGAIREGGQHSKDVQNTGSGARLPNPDLPCPDANLGQVT